MPERAVRDRVIIAFPGMGDWTEITADEPRSTAPIFQFCSGEQIADREGEDWAPESDTRFALRAWDVLRFAVSRGFLETLAPEQADAIRECVRFTSEP